MFKQDLTVIKRSKVLFVTLLLTTTFFLYRLMSSSSFNLENFLIIVGISFVFSYLGALWIEDFTFKKESLYLEILQVALFVGFEVAFMQTFFATALARLYEAFLLVIILVIFFLSTYFAYLTMNLFVVSRFKNLPLLDVATTTSYIYTIVSAFYVTYFALSLSINPFVAFLLVFLLLSIYFLIEIINVRHVLDWKGALVDALILSYISTISIIPACMWNRFPEFIALIPAVLVFIMLGALMHKEHGVEDKIPLVSYLLAFLFTLYLVVLYR